MKKLFLCLLLFVFAGQVLATGPVRGDSVYLFNSGATGSAFAGYWVTAANDGTGPAPVHPLTSWALYNDGSLTPTPNNPLGGDVNGDGVCDIVTYGKDATVPNPHTIMLGRNSGVSNVAPGVDQGDLFQPSVGPAGWQPAPAGNWSPFWTPLPAEPDYHKYFIGDVDGDGYDDAVAARGVTGNPGLVVFTSNHSDAEGLEGHAPAASTSWFGVANVGTALMGDFNGDGTADIANQDAGSTVVGQVSTPGLGLDPTAPTFWGGMGFAANHVATLVGDINGDGMDDIVQVDDRNSNGSWTWVVGLTTVNGAIPAGVEVATPSAMSWCSPFTLDPASLNAVPLLADMDNDGRGDLVLYEEYTDAGSGNTWGRLLTSLTDDPLGGLFTNGYDGGSWYDYVTLFGADASGMIPIVGNIHIPEPATMLLLGLGGFGLIRRKR